MSEILNVLKLLVSGLGREFMKMFVSLLNVCFENADVHQTRNHHIQLQTLEPGIKGRLLLDTMILWYLII